MRILALCRRTPDSSPRTMPPPASSQPVTTCLHPGLPITKDPRQESIIEGLIGSIPISRESNCLLLPKTPGFRRFNLRRLRRMLSKLKRLNLEEGIFSQAIWLNPKVRVVMADNQSKLQEKGLPSEAGLWIDSIRLAPNSKKISTPCLISTNRPLKAERSKLAKRKSRRAEGLELRSTSPYHGTTEPSLRTRPTTRCSTPISSRLRARSATSPDPSLALLIGNSSKAVSEETMRRWYSSNSSTG